MIVKKWSTRLVAIGAMVAVFAMAQEARAIGTTAGTAITNSASVTFTAAGATQTVVGAAPDITVDRRVDLTVAELSGAYTMVVTGAGQQAVGFTVTNTGNDVFDVLLSAVDQVGGAGPFGPTLDTYDSTINGAQFYLDDGAGSPGVFDVSDDTAITSIDNLPADDGVGTETVTVWVVRDIPGGLSAGPPMDLSVIHLVGEARDFATGNALTNNNGDNDVVGGAAQNVFADIAGSAAGDIASDARHSAADGYLVESATMTISKTSEVVSDPTGAVAPLAKAIPGAVIEYTITINNTGTAQATGVTITDDLTLEIATNGTVAFDAAAYGAGQGIQLNVNGGGAAPLTNVTGDDQGEFVGNVVTVDGITLNNSENAVVNFRVVVQ